MMNRHLTIIIAAVCTLLLMAACVSDPDDKDMTMPFIEDSEESYPQQCEVYQPGGVIPLRCTFSDDMELGNFNVEIHNNFDHHTHSTSAVECEYDEHDEDEHDEDEHNEDAHHEDESPCPMPMTNMTSTTRPSAGYSIRTIASRLDRRYTRQLLTFRYQRMRKKVTITL